MSTFQAPDRGILISKVPIQRLLYKFNLSHLQAVPVRSNEYMGKINQTVTKDKELYKSDLGTPVVADLQFEPVRYRNYKTGKIVATDRIKLETVLLTVMQVKQIVRTEIQGGHGTIKEYISDGDYSVSINGIICGPNGSYPMNEVLALKRMLDAPVSIPVISTFLNNMGVFDIVVDDYTFPQSGGSYSRQDFSISASSDIPLILQIIN